MYNVHPTMIIFYQYSALEVNQADFNVRGLI